MSPLLFGGFLLVAAGLCLPLLWGALEEFDEAISEDLLTLECQECTVTPMETLYVITYGGQEWGFFSAEDLEEMGLTPSSKNVREARASEVAS